MKCLFTAVFKFSPHMIPFYGDLIYHVEDATLRVDEGIAAALAQFLKQSHAKARAINKEGEFSLVSHSVTVLEASGSELHPKLSKLLKAVPEEHREDLLTFVEKGEGTPEFLALLDQNSDIQAFIEQAFELQAAAVERLVRHLHGEVTEKS